MFPRRALFLAATLLAASTPLVAAEKPSFPCSEAHNAREKVVCGNARLARADRDMAVAWGEARRRLDPDLKSRLVEDQKAFLVGLDDGFDASMWFKAGVPEEPQASADIRRVLKQKDERLTDLAIEIERRTGMLRGLRSDRAGIDGTWTSHDVDLKITAAGEGRHAVVYEAPSYGWIKYHCAFRGVARPVDGGFVVDMLHNEDFDEDRFTTLDLRRDGPLLRLTEHRPADAANDESGRSFNVCNHRPSLEDALFATDPHGLPARRGRD